MKERSDIAVVGLGVMGSGIARNLESRGYTVSVYNRSQEKTDAFLQQYGSGNFRCAHSLEELCGQLEVPRKILLMVKAGDAVDGVLQEIVSFLAPGDVLIDGGNSYYEDTQRRAQLAEDAGLLYVGCGISGGEEGALNGPAVMPGGSEAAKELVMPFFLDICARTELGDACCHWMGSGGAGHFVKMVHNGIEYAEMQFLCEIWDLMRKYLGMDTAMCGRTYARWAQKTPSYLMEIAGQVLQKQGRFSWNIFWMLRGRKAPEPGRSAPEWIWERPFPSFRRRCRRDCCPRRKICGSKLRKSTGTKTTGERLFLRINASRYCRNFRMRCTQRASSRLRRGSIF